MFQFCGCSQGVIGFLGQVNEFNTGALAQI